METGSRGSPHGSPTETLYDPAVAKMQRLSVENARKTFGEVLRKAAEEKLHTVVTRHGADMGVLVPIADYKRYREQDGDPTEL